MKKRVTKKMIKSQAHELAESIRTYVRDQKDLWNRVPWLALEADGRTGYCDSFSRAYRLGVWAIEASCVSGYYRVYVDLATGELINTHPFHDQGGALELADDEDVLQLATRLEQLNATTIVKELEIEAEEPIASYYDPKRQAAERVAIKKKLGIRKIYTADQRGAVPQPSYFD